MCWYLGHGWSHWRFGRLSGEHDWHGERRRRHRLGVDALHNMGNKTTEGMTMNAAPCPDCGWPVLVELRGGKAHCSVCGGVWPVLPIESCSRANENHRRLNPELYPPVTWGDVTHNWDTFESASEGHRGRFSPETERMIEATSQRAELRRLAQATYNAKMLFERIMMDAYLFAGANPRMMV